jgi:hypothetical protein
MYSNNLWIDDYTMHFDAHDTFVVSLEIGSFIHRVHNYSKVIITSINVWWAAEPIFSYQQRKCAKEDL